MVRSDNTPLAVLKATRADFVSLEPLPSWGFSLFDAFILSSLLLFAFVTLLPFKRLARSRKPIPTSTPTINTAGMLAPNGVAKSMNQLYANKARESNVSN